MATSTELFEPVVFMGFAFGLIGEVSCHEQHIVPVSDLGDSVYYIYSCIDESLETKVVMPEMHAFIIILVDQRSLHR